MNIPDLSLNQGPTIPQLGFGVFQVPDDQAADAVAEALAAGYRSIDTAAIYGNEEGVGRAVAASGLRREELFITTKLWNDAHGAERAAPAYQQSLDRLGLDHVDLLLIHWPAPAQGRYAETWRALEALQSSGRVRAIGVSNFTAAQLEVLAAESGIVPAVNQVELHPYLQQLPTRAYNQEHGIRTEAWSPLAQGAVLTDPVIARLAAAHGRTPAQIVLRWHLQQGRIVIPKSVTPARIRENLDVFGFDLSEDDLAAIDGLDRGLRTGPDPETFNG